MGEEKENNRVIQWLVLPFFFLMFLFLAVFRGSFMYAGIFYLVLCVYGLIAFKIPAFKEEINGIRGNFIMILGHYGIGITAAIGFMFLSAISPVFSLLTPTLSLTIAENVRWFIIVITAPILEEVWRVSTLAFFEETYRGKFWIRNIFQAFLFALIHLFVYGVILQAYDKWILAYGAMIAISGSLLAAFLFGLISGWLIHKFRTIVVGIGAHQTINFWLMVNKAFSVS